MGVFESNFLIELFFSFSFSNYILKTTLSKTVTYLKLWPTLPHGSFLLVLHFVGSVQVPFYGSLFFNYYYNALTLHGILFFPIKFLFFDLEYYWYFFLIVWVLLIDVLLNNFRTLIATHIFKFPTALTNRFLHSNRFNHII